MAGPGSLFVAAVLGTALVLVGGCLAGVDVAPPPSMMAAAQPVTEVGASSALVRWVGRTEAQPGGGVAFDWAGVAATISVQGPVTHVLARIRDNCKGTTAGGGSRWAVDMTTEDGRAAAPNHRIQTFYTAAVVTEYVLFSLPGGRCDPYCTMDGVTTLRLTRLTESRLSGCSAEGSLVVEGFSTDARGGFVPPPPPPQRRLAFIGDSITAGDLNDGGLMPDGSADLECGNASWNNDITAAAGGVLCSPRHFAADCIHTAWGGIRLGTPSQGWGMTDLFPSLFSAAGQGTEYGAYNFTSFPVDAVVINLGTNDQPVSPADDWVTHYVQFCKDIVRKYYKNPDLVVFVGYGPMTSAYQPFVTRVVSSLVSGGVRARLLDLTLPHAMTGCYGHPSAADNREIALKAAAQIGPVLGWRAAGLE